MDILTYLPTVLPLIAGAIASVATYFAGKSVNKRDDFSTLVKANEEFRNEIRADLSVAREELQKAKDRILFLETELENRNTMVYQLQIQIIALQSQIASLEKYNDGKNTT